MRPRFPVGRLRRWKAFCNTTTLCAGLSALLVDCCNGWTVSDAGAWIYEYQSISSLAAKLALSGLVPDEDEEIIPPPELPPPLTPTWWCTAAQGVAVFVSCAFVVWFLLGLLLSTLELYTR